jgi:hypothetical protein
MEVACFVAPANAGVQAFRAYGVLLWAWITNCFLQFALRAISCCTADVRSGILPAQSGLRRDDEMLILLRK